jgi:hypothetical protein
MPIVGRLSVSQLLTLHTTPVIYLYLDAVSRWLQRLRGSGGSVSDAAPVLGE